MGKDFLKDTVVHYHPIIITLLVFAMLYLVSFCMIIANFYGILWAGNCFEAFYFMIMMMYKMWAVFNYIGRGKPRLSWCSLLTIFMCSFAAMSLFVFPFDLLVDPGSRGDDDSGTQPQGYYKIATLSLLIIWTSMFVAIDVAFKLHVNKSHSYFLKIGKLYFDDGYTYFPMKGKVSISESQVFDLFGQDGVTNCYMSFMVAELVLCAVTLVVFAATLTIGGKWGPITSSFFVVPLLLAMLDYLFVTRSLPVGDLFKLASTSVEDDTITEITGKMNFNFKDIAAGALTLGGAALSFAFKNKF